MEVCDHCKVPVMASFHNLAGSQNTFRLLEIEKNSTLESVLLSVGPAQLKSADNNEENIEVKVSSSRSGSYDKFSLNNTVSLVSRVLKTDVIWIIFEKQMPPPVQLSTINAFDLLKTAANARGLPDKLLNPFNQKQEVFNQVLVFLKDQNVTFSKSDCEPRIKNRKTGAATELVFEITDIIWRIGQAEKQLKSSGLWNKVPDIISKLATFEQKSKDPVRIDQYSSKNFATHIREIASKALMASPNLADLKLAMLSCAEIFVKYSGYLKTHLENVKNKASKDKSISTATEAVILQISNREKVSLIEKGGKSLTNLTVKSIFKELEQKGDYQPLNISTMLPTNRYSRSTILHRDIPNQAPQKCVLWTFDNGPGAPQSIFAFTVDPNDNLQTILDRTNKLKPKLQSLQKFFFPREFYQQFYERIGAVTGISSQDLKLVCSMTMGDDRKFDGEVQKRFEEAVMSGDPDFVYDMRYFNGSDIKYKEYLAEFRSAVQEYMVEDRGRHETKYDGTVISKVSFGFSLKQMFKAVCAKVKEKNPDCPLPQSESMISRYLIPRTKAAAESACRSEPLIPLKLAMQQKVIEKPSVDAHYNAAQYKYIRSFAVELGQDVVCMVGWDDKTGVDVGEPEQPTVATQHAGKSWVHQERPVGEGQHTFHKTNLTPSVRLVHEIGESVDDSFYRGLPQVVIKDSIFQPSSSSRHATELFQMFQSKPDLRKPVKILTNDGGSDHTIRHERNIAAMLALFLWLPETLFLINFQMAAYRSAYHPVEKLNCILNLAWNGVSLSRGLFEDPVLEKAFGQCNSMADVRIKAERHPGIQKALQKSLEPSIKILEDRAKQASLKENSFETFMPASEDEIKQFLNILLEIDDEFDVERFLDKKKPFHFSPKLKAYIDEHLSTTYYSLTFMKHANMTKEFLLQNYPGTDWQEGLDPLPCPLIDKDNPERYLRYDKIKVISNKDYSDTCRPGAVKTPSNIPFTKTKQKAMYGAKLSMTCEICNKSRVVYIEQKPKDADIEAAKAALRDVRYICGGRMSSFGRSLAVLEEITEAVGRATDITDEIEVECLDGSEYNAQLTPDVDVSDEFDDFEEPVRKKKKILIIESDESDDEPPIDAFDLLQNPEQTMTVAEETFTCSEVSSSRNSKASCSICGNFETGHKCKSCHAACCNLCNASVVEEETDLPEIICPNCQEHSKEPEPESKPRKRGRPRKKVDSGAILIPLVKRGRGRPPKAKHNIESDVIEDSNNNVGTTDINVEEEKETEIDASSLAELRMLGTGNILKKLFVDESLRCDSPLEPHMFDILISLRKPLPCSYCGEKEEERLFSNLTEEQFPLCKSCNEKGRGAGVRRKSRKIQAKPVKQTKPKVSTKKKLKVGKLI